MTSSLIENLKFDSNGLIPVIAQDHKTGDVLMVAWMNKVAFLETVQSSKMCYFSRSRNKLWRKGESSGQAQKLIEMLLDCDGDTLLAKVEQTGVACHTGRRSCFYKTINGSEIKINQEVVIPPGELYKND